jgi:hypothetical protein
VNNKGKEKKHRGEARKEKKDQEQVAFLLPCPVHHHGTFFPKHPTASKEIQSQPEDREIYRYL